MSVNKEILIKDKSNNYSFYDLSDFRLKKLNHFKGWNCYLGQENMSISFQGDTFGSVCQKGPKLGNIFNEEVKLSNEPIKCPIDVCHCGSDILIKKSKGVALDNIQTHTPQETIMNDNEIYEVDGNYKIRNNKTLFIDWIIAKKCNFDCSYCPTHVHDSTSPHVQPDQFQHAKKNIANLLETNKQLKITFTGGEPTLNPYYLGFVKSLNDLGKDKVRLITNTNGSRLAKYFCELNHLSALFFSVHIDYVDINKFLEKISKITYYRRKEKLTLTSNFFILKVMVTPDNFDKCISFYKSTFKLRREWNDLQVHLEPIVKKEHNFKLLPFSQSQYSIMKAINKHDKLFSTYKRSAMREESKSILFNKKNKLNEVATQIGITTHHSLN